MTKDTINTYWKTVCDGVCDFVSTDGCQTFGMEVGRITDTSMINGRRVIGIWVKDNEEYRKEFGCRVLAPIQFWLNDSITVRCKDPVFCRNTGKDAWVIWDHMKLEDQKTGKHYIGGTTIIVTPFGGKSKDIDGTPFNVIETGPRFVYTDKDIITDHDAEGTITRLNRFMDLQMRIIPVQLDFWNSYDEYKAKKTAIEEEMGQKIDVLRQEMLANAHKTINKQHILCERTQCCVDRDEVLAGHFKYKEI